MNINELFYKILSWANDRNIIKGGTPKDQCLKLIQEFYTNKESLMQSGNIQKRMNMRVVKQIRTQLMTN